MAETVQQTVTVGGVTINAGTPIMRLAERISQLMAELADAKALADSEGTRAVEAIRQKRANAKDAARYRWLRDRRCTNNRWPHITMYPWHESIDGPVQMLPVHDVAGYHPDRLDAWIDAGIAATGVTEDKKC